MKKIYLLLIACCIGLFVSAQTTYQPSGTSAFSGGNTYCVGDPISPLTFNYTTCNSGTGGSIGSSCTVTWYYNPTNTTVISGATTIASTGGPAFPCAVTPVGTINYTPALSVGGNYYFFCVVSWTAGTTGCGGASGSITSPTQLVRISPPPIGPASTVDVCLMQNMTLTNAFAGGVWSSTNPGVVSVNSTTGVIRGETVGSAIIVYTLGGCSVTAFIHSNDTPTVITPTTPVDICVGGTTTLADASSGGTWSSSLPASASVGSSTGFVSAFAAGSVTISYTFTSTGCFTTKTINVIANPAPISGSTAICLGGNTTLSDATPGGIWTSSAPSNAPVGVFSGVVTGLVVGTATITYTLSSGCYTTTLVTVNTAPGTITGPTQVCAGSTITLGNPISGGAWSSGNTDTATVATSTGVVSGVGSGTVRITYTIAGCAPVSRSLTVNPLPGTISGVFSTCYNDTTTLSSTVAGGTWSSSNTTIASAVSATSISGYIIGHTMGTATISYSVGSGCSTSVTVTVNPVADIVGSDSVCVASSISLTNIVGGGTWVSSNPAVASINTTTGFVTGLITGITYIGYTLPTGCARTFFLDVIPPLPTIAGSTMICSGSVVTLSNGVTGGRWSSSNMYVAGIDSVTGVTSGHFPDTATVTYTKFGCVTSALLTINPLPTPVLTFVWSTNSLTTYAGYAAYQWYDSTSTGVVAIAGATNSTFSLPATAGKFAVMVTDGNGCSSRTEWYRHAVGINDVTGDQYHVFPNPAVATVYVIAPVTVKAVISSIDGKSLLAVPHAKEIYIGDLSAGIYFIRLYDDNGQLVNVQKLIKQ